jgi:hypothetical protein
VHQKLLKITKVYETEAVSPELGVGRRRQASWRLGAIWIGLVLGGLELSRGPRILRA